MIHLLAALFLLAHGAVFTIMLALPFSETAAADLPFRPQHSWLLGDDRGLALGLAIAVTAAFAIAAAAVAVKLRWSPELAILAAGLSIVFLALYFDRYWTAGFAISAIIIAVGWWARGRV